MLKRYLWIGIALPAWVATGALIGYQSAHGATTTDLVLRFTLAAVALAATFIASKRTARP